MKAVKGKRGGARPGAGRKKGSTATATQDQRVQFAEACRQRHSRLLELIDKILDKKNEKALLRAPNLFMSITNFLAAYGVGRPAQMSNGEGAIKGLLHLTPEQLANLGDHEFDNLDKLLTQLAGSQSRDGRSSEDEAVGEDDYAATVSYTGQG